jgi:cytochrome c biogenesis protein CcdA/thiol-disulfide isomerase/thioredoxin
MTLLLVAYLGGVLTILSPCILPIIPFVLARADRRFATNGLPLLLGMAAAFAVVGALAAVVGEWAVTANRYGRNVALVVLAVFGFALLLPRFADQLARPFVALGNRLSQGGSAGTGGDRQGIVPSLVLGLATGLLWAPCAGPILGLIFGAAALQGANARTSLMLLAYALGAGTSLAVALLAGRRVFTALKASLGTSEGLRRALGAAVIVAVVAILFGVDTGLLARLSSAGTNRIEQALIDRAGADRQSAGPAMAGGTAMTGGGAMSGGAAMSGGPSMAASAAAGALPVEKIVPSLAGPGPWLNSKPLQMSELKGKVVLIDFWTYSCINCVRAIPYVRAWSAKYRDRGLIVIGVHTPEFAFEKLADNVRRAVKDMQIDYPVVLDNDYSIWRAFDNRYWPAHYFVDAEGRIRHHHFGEGGYDESERVIQRLLAEAGASTKSEKLVIIEASGAAAASDQGNVLSPETYIGYERAENFVSPGGAGKDVERKYADGDPRLNEWGLRGTWTIGSEAATAASQGGSIVYRFHARDLHLVLGGVDPHKRVRFKVTLDGAPPGKNHGADVDDQGNGVIDGQRLYQLIRQDGPVEDRRFEILFLDPGAQAFAFTFG